MGVGLVAKCEGKRAAACPALAWRDETMRLFRVSCFSGKAGRRLQRYPQVGPSRQAGHRHSQHVGAGHYRHWHPAHYLAQHVPNHAAGRAGPGGGEGYGQLVGSGVGVRGEAEGGLGAGGGQHGVGAGRFEAQVVVLNITARLALGEADNVGPGREQAGREGEAQVGEGPVVAQSDGRIGGAGRKNARGGGGDVGAVYLHEEGSLVTSGQRHVHRRHGAGRGGRGQRKVHLPLGRGGLGGAHHVVGLHVVPVSSPATLPNGVLHVLRKLSRIVHKLSPVGVGVGVAHPVVVAGVSARQHVGNGEIAGRVSFHPKLVVLGPELKIGGAGGGHLRHGYMWKPKSTKANVNPNVGMPLANASRTANVKDTITS
nr:hypothetical protein [Tanacetum cinerariifolium]